MREPAHSDLPKNGGTSNAPYRATMVRLLVFALGLALLAAIALKVMRPDGLPALGQPDKAPRTLEEVRAKAKRIEDEQRKRAEETMKRSE